MNGFGWVNLRNLLRAVLGGGSDIDISTEFSQLKEALRTIAEASVDTGIADATSTVNYLERTGHPALAGLKT